MPHALNLTEAALASNVATTAWIVTALGIGITYNALDVGNEATIGGPGADYPTFDAWQRANYRAGVAAFIVGGRIGLAFAFMVRLSRRWFPVRLVIFGAIPFIGPASTAFAFAKDPHDDESQEAESE